MSISCLVFLSLSLRIFEVFGCFNITPSGIKLLGQSCKKLQTLNIGQCHKVYKIVLKLHFYDGSSVLINLFLFIWYNCDGYDLRFSAFCLFLFVASRLAEVLIL